MAERLKIYDVLHNDYLCRICLNLPSLDRLDQLFRRLDDHQIKLKFLAFLRGPQNLRHISFCVERSHLKTVRSMVEQLLPPDTSFDFFDEAGTVAIYGPHFGERFGILDSMHHALTSQGVEVMGISTTVSTSFLVVRAEAVGRAVAILKQLFEIPSGKA